MIDLLFFVLPFAVLVASIAYYACLALDEAARLPEAKATKSLPTSTEWYVEAPRAMGRKVAVEITRTYRGKPQALRIGKSIHADDPEFDARLVGLMALAEDRAATMNAASQEVAER